MKKILLTGKSGFIGKNLEKELKKRYNLFAPDHNELDLFDYKKVREYFSKNYFDVVIHTANVNATRNRNCTDYYALDGNLRMFFNLVDCNQSYGKMYYFGSGAEYDSKNYIPFMKEDYFAKYVPTDSYGFSKYIMSKFSEQKNNIYDLRLFGVYGKYEEWERRFISNAICRALKGMDITIEKNVYFDYLWVDDLCKIIDWFINSAPKYKQYNVCRGDRVDLYSLANTVRDILNIDCNIVVKEKGFKREYSGNNDRLINEIGNFRFTEYRTSIAELASYYKKNIQQIDETMLL